MGSTSSIRFSPPRFASLLPEASRWLVPLVAWAAIRGMSATQSDPSARAEAELLGFLCAAVLVAAAALATFCGRGRSAPELGWVALLATAAVWTGHLGPSRSAVVTALLVVCLAAAARRAWRSTAREHSPGGPLPPGLTVPVAMGLQLLTRCDLLLPPLLEARTLVSLLLLPALAGVSLSVLGARFGARRAALAGAAAVVAAPGWNVTVTLGLLALAVGVLAADRRLPKAARWGCGLLLVLLPLWRPALGSLFALGGAALVMPPRRRPWGLAAGALVALVAPAVQGPAAAIGLWLGGLALLPALLAAPADGRARAIHGVALALLAARLHDAPEALTAGLALAALGAPADGTAGALQRLWCGVAVTGTSLLAVYPWVRQTPLADLWALFGLPAGAAARLGVLAVGVALAVLWDRRRPAGTRRRPAWALGGLLFAGAVAGASPSAVLLHSYQAVTLQAQQTRWIRSFDEQPVAAVVLDTNLVRGVELAPETPVAEVRLVDASRTLLESWTLRAGTETAEWAAARPDIAARPGFAAPRPWLSRLAPDGTFFARLFRARFQVSPPRPAVSLVIQRSPELPAEVELVVYRVEIRR